MTMKTPRPVDNLFIFVDGQNLISHIQALFPEEFDREDYLPRTANWKAFFGSIAKTLRANTLDVYWYTIKDLDYSPNIDWEKEDLDQLSQVDYITWRQHIIRSFVLEAHWGKRAKMKLTDPELEYYVAKGDEKKEIISRWRRKFFATENEMERRLREWHQILENIAQQCPNVQIRRTGWQPCFLSDRRLGTEKGVDTGLVADLVYYGSEYDTALIFSSDGDYVPAVRCIQKMGKQVGHIELQSRDGQPVKGISRRLSEMTDFTLEIPFKELQMFLNLPDDPVKKRRDPHQVEEKEAERRELIRRFQEEGARQNR